MHESYMKWQVKREEKRKRKKASDFHVIICYETDETEQCASEHFTK